MTLENLCFMPLKQKSRKRKTNVEHLSKILWGRVAMSVHIFYLGQQSSGNFDSCSLVVITALPEGAQIKVLGSSCSVRVHRQDLYSKHMWNLYPKRVELQVKSFIKCHMILVESIRRQNTHVSNKAESYPGWIIVILVWGMREIMFLFGKNMTGRLELVLLFILSG